MSANDLLLSLLTDPTAVPSAEDVSLLEQAYPYLAFPAAMRLKRAPSLDPEERKALILKVATASPGCESLFRLTDPDGELLAGFMPAAKAPAPTASDTDSAIDTFLDRYGRMSPKEEALLEKLIFNPMPDDYAALLVREAEAQKTSPEDSEAAKRSQKHDRMLDAFLEEQTGKQDAKTAKAEPKAVEPQAPKPPVKAAPQQHQTDRKSAAVSPNPSASLSESLAHVYIKRGRYDKAYDIIHALSLNNPKKSVYFADQLRFLQKLMLIQSRSK